MSQISQFLDTASGSAIFSLTGDTGGPVAPDGLGNVDILGGTNIGTVGTPNTITINLDNTITLTTVNATTFDTNVAAAGVTLSGTTLSADGTDADIDINITAKGSGQVIIDDLQLTTPLAVTEGGTGVSSITDHSLIVGSGTGAITELAVGSTGETLMGSTGADPGWTNSPSFGGSVTAATGITITTGDLDVSSGKINLPTTSSSDGQITINSSRVFHSYGSNNLFIGENSGNFTTTGSLNLGLGRETLGALTSGGRNVCIGSAAGDAITDGDANCLLGISTGLGITSGVYNTFLGKTTAYQVTTGSYNVVIGTSSASAADGTGFGAGNSLGTTSSSNILICNDGASESNTIRIGTQGSGDKQQDTTYIAGIYNTTPSGGSDNVVIIDSNGQLGGTTTLSVANGGTGLSSITDHSLIVGSGTGAVTELGVATNGQLPIGSTGADPVLANITGTSNIVEVINGAGTIDLDVSDALKINTGFESWDGGAPYFDDTTIGSFTISQGGSGYINGVRVTWSGGQTVTGLLSGVTYLIYIDSTGTIGKDSTFDDSVYCNNIVLFECLRDSSLPTNNQLTVKENHPYDFYCQVSNYLHDTVGTIIENINNGANITLNGTQKIEIVGTDILADHGLYTTIPDSGGTAEIFYQMYTNASGKWALYTVSDTFTGYYNNAGTPTAIGTAKYAVYSLYVSKNDLNSAIPNYGAVLDTSEYSNLTAAQTAIASGNIAKPTAELEKLETALLGYIIYSESTSSIVDVIIEKATLQQTVSTTGSNIASLVLTDTSNFDGILSVSDTNVQSALETIDDWGASTTDHALLVGNGTGSPIGSLAVGATGEILIGNTGADPSWSSTPTVTTINATTFDTNVAAAGVTLSGTTLSADGTDANIDINITPKGTGVIAGTELTLTTDLEVQYGGTGVSTLTQYAVLLGNGTSGINTVSGVGTSGQILTSNGAGADPTWQDAPGIVWSEVTGTSQSMSVNNGYILNNAALVTATLPATAAIGDVIEVVGKGAGGWTIAQNAGQTIHFISSDTTTGVGGSLSSTNRYDSLRLVCITANTDFSVVSSVGNITVV